MLVLQLSQATQREAGYLSAQPTQEISPSPGSPPLRPSPETAWSAPKGLVAGLVAGMRGEWPLQAQGQQGTQCGDVHQGNRVVFLFICFHL